MNPLSSFKYKIFSFSPFFFFNQKRWKKTHYFSSNTFRNILELNITVTSFLNKYPHVFDVFTHPLRRNTCCRITRKMRELTMVEEVVIRQHEIEAVKRVKKLLMISINGTLYVHVLRLIRRELGICCWKYG